MRVMLRSLCALFQVRLMAAESLKMVVDDFNFAVEDLSSVLLCF